MSTATPSTSVGGSRPGSGAQRQAEDNGGVWATIRQVAFFWIVSQLASQFLIKPYFNQGQNNAASPIPSSADPSVSTDSLAPGQSLKTTPADTVAKPIWPLGTPLSLDVYITSSPAPQDVFVKKGRENVTLAHVEWTGVRWGDWNVEQTWTGDIPIPTSVQRNESAIYAHLFLAADGVSHNPTTQNFHPSKVAHVIKRLTHYRPQKRVVKEKNLLASTNDTDVVAEEPDVDYKKLPWVPYWYQNFTLALISDGNSIPINQLPPPLKEHVQLVPSTLSNSLELTYYPVLYQNKFWHLNSHYQAYNELNSTLPLRIDFHALSWMKFQIYASMTHGFENAAQQQGAGAGAELDEVKRMFLETSPWLLIVTALVSVLHTVFEFLAFTADVGHWRKKQEFVGISVRSIITNVFVQVIILLYLIDNNEETSWMILFGQGTGAAIEAWKITKVLDFKLIAAPPGSLLPYRIEVKDKHVLSEDEKKTQEYDKLAYRYVSYVAVPLLAGYTIYSLMYESHKGWYSFTIRTLTSFVYTFGFAQLVPQLIINYKLKSVAHLPTKAFVYKFLGTIVDDFFAFCIKMPFLHRLACFRDDVVFLIFLYQRWIYRVDFNRVNEFGQVSDQAEEKPQVADGEHPIESKKDK